MNNILRTHKVRLYPTKEQENLLNKSVGVARFAFNWSLNRWNELYLDDKKPNARNIRNEFVKLKNNEEYLWLKEVSKEAYSNAILDMGNAWSRFFKKQSKGKPKFKSKKKSKESYTEVSTKDGYLAWKQNSLYIPNFRKNNCLKTAEFPRFKGIIKRITISKQAGLWFASVLFKLDKAPIKQYKRFRNKVDKVGIDLGIKTLATLSDGFYFDKTNTNCIDKKIAKKQKELSKKIYGSSNYFKAKTKLQRLYMKKANILNNNLHEITNYIVRKYNKICIEDLSASNMLKNHKLARSIANAQFYEFRRQLEYKINYLKEKGVSVVLLLANRFFPSSKKCSNCGNTKKKLSLSERIYKCNECGIKIDRDYNASINLRNLLINHN